MSAITIQFANDSAADELLNAMALQTGWTEQVTNPDSEDPGKPHRIKNPVTREQHNCKQIQKFMAEQAKIRIADDIVRKAQETASVEAAARIDSLITAAGMTFNVLKPGGDA